jgi:hypothetical protein
MSLYISVPLGTSGPPFSNDKDPIPMDLHFHKRGVYFDFLVERTSASVYELYNYYNPIIYGNHVLLAQKIEWPELSTLRKIVTSIPTFILGGLYTHKGRVMMDFRFHGSDVQNVLGLVKFVVSINVDVRVPYMGKSEGLKAKLSEIQTRAPMSVVKFSYRDDSNKNYVLEWRGITGPSSAVSFGEDGEGEIGPLDISKAPILPLLLSLIRDQIPIVGYFENHKGGMVNSMVILPSCLTKAFLVRYFELTRKLREIKLQSVESYGTVMDSL